MTLSTLLACMMVLQLEGVISSPLICHTDVQPSVYNLPSADPCSTISMMKAQVTVAYNQSQHTKVQGWKMTVNTVTCETHYFFMGSYTSELSSRPSTEPMFPESDIEFLCPSNALRFVDAESLTKSLCEYSWPTSYKTVKDVCYIEPATLISIDGVATVDGHPVDDCDTRYCRVSKNVRFSHGLGSLPTKSERITHFSGEGRCNKNICVIPSTGEAYSLVKPVSITNTTEIYESISGAEITLVWTSDTREAVQPEASPRSDVSTLAKIMGLESSIQVLEREVENICVSVKALYGSVRSLSMDAPTAAASLYLNRTDVMAHFMGGKLMVWPCVVVDEWGVRPANSCKKYIPIFYKVKGGQMDGYLDPSMNQVYTWSPAGDCSPNYFVKRGVLIKVIQSQGGVKTYPILNVTKQVGPIFNPIERMASEWSTKEWALKENHPHEFSYSDITAPSGINGRSWLDQQITEHYPFLSYIAHLKAATICLTLFLTGVTIWTVSAVFHLRITVRRLESCLVGRMMMDRL